MTTAPRNGASVANAEGNRSCVTRMNLEVLGGVGVDHSKASLNIVDEDDGALRPRQGFSHTLGMLGGQYLHG